MRLADKIALITGGGRGVGRVVALTFAREGADIAICARTESELKNTAAEVEKLGRRCFLQTCDVTVGEQCQAMVQGALRHFGRLDILVNNAGGGDVARYSTVGKADDAWWFDNIALNLHSTFFFCRAVLPHMVERRYGRIVNISSIAGLRGLPNMASYAAAKHGVEGLSRSIALETGKLGITCNSICPGSVRAGWTTSEGGAGKAAKALGMTMEEYTNVTAKAHTTGKIVEPEEIAELAAFLASDLSRTTTGQSIMMGFA
ncbi:MAG TPA: SDR family NAD(P)-dependent oxidoreductase [Candidatus Binataceae bacterium]|jgi:NAD(P)-dependent dehydrogenase (short-subunit alcohol dehydrogenase family)|nr:SDR family NAD(P)-dependent oxidoreductase [Candidatus Binataceae bacterium]